MYDSAAEQQLMATSKYGSCLTCPGCGGEEFCPYYASYADLNFEVSNPQLVLAQIKNGEFGQAYGLI